MVRSPRTGVKVGVLGTKPGPSAGAEILLMLSHLQRTRFALRHIIDCFTSDFVDSLFAVEPKNLPGPVSSDIVLASRMFFWVLDDSYVRSGRMFS